MAALHLSTSPWSERAAASTFKWQDDHLLLSQKSIMVAAGTAQITLYTSCICARHRHRMIYAYNIVGKKVLVVLETHVQTAYIVIA